MFERKTCSDNSVERFEAIFKHSIDAIMLTSPDGHIIAANPAACRMFGRTQDEIIRIGREGIVDITDPNFKIFLAPFPYIIYFLWYLRQDGANEMKAFMYTFWKDLYNELISGYTG